MKRADFKPDMLGTHLFMNLRIIDEHGRQLAQGRNIAALKAQWGSKARGAFQALASLKIASSAEDKSVSEPKQPKNTNLKAQPAPEKDNSPGTAAPHAAGARHTSWDFGQLPELMEIQQGKQTLIGFPALIDQGDAVTIEVFDEPDIAAARHRQGLRRLCALQVKDALKYLEKNIPDLQKMAVAYMPLGTQEELRAQILDVALERAFVQEPLPQDAAQFAQRVQEGRARLTLIAQEVARLAATILTEYASAQRKIKDTKNAQEATEDAGKQLQNLMPKDFIARTPWAQLQHFAPERS